MTNPEQKEEPEEQPDTSQPPGGAIPSPAVIEPIQHPTTESPSEEMEVHHHTHSHGKKNWKSYIWEFLMLFLAVFCGFLAEYQLEHTIEHQRERTFIRSMIEDLQEDHEKLNLYTASLSVGLVQMDSMITLLDNPQLIKENPGLLYYFARISPRLDALTSNNRTLEQLKNSGSFRLIRSTQAANRITTYYGKIDFIRHLENFYFEEFVEYKKIAAGLLEPAVMRAMELPDGQISRAAVNASLRTNDPDRLKELSVLAVYMNGSRRSLIPAAKLLQANGDTLIAFLKKEYHLD